MPNTLITGGTGKLGKQLAAFLTERGVPYTIGSRSNSSGATNITVLDLLRNKGVEEAVAGKDVIFHLATDLKKESEVTRNLLKAVSPGSGVHLIFTSIVGIDKVPLGYYRQKLASENAIKESGVSYTILRATQFHEFIDQMLSTFLRFPIGLLPRSAVSQPIQTEMVAAELHKLSLGPASNQTYEIGGAETLTFEQMTVEWLRHTGKRRAIFNLPLWGTLGKTVRNGGLTTSNRRGDSMTWKQWLQHRYPS